MAVKNHNFRFNMEKDNEVRAWEILHSKEVKEDFRSQNEFVIAAINDYYDRHLDKKQDSYLESREKEEAFTQNIVNAVEQKVLDNLPGLAVMYMMQQQSLLSVTYNIFNNVFCTKQIHFRRFRHSFHHFNNPPAQLTDTIIQRGI